MEVQTAANRGEIFAPGDPQIPYLIMSNPIDEEGRPRAAKISISMPESMVQFIDEQCRLFRVGRSTYLQMLLEAEQAAPREEFTKRAQRPS